MYSVSIEPVKIYVSLRTVVGSVPATYSQVIVAGPCEVQFVGVSIVRAEIKGVTNANKLLDHPYEYFPLQRG